ncbi:MAG: type II toxin-antitoxin system HicB family antitoxin [Candidatus Aminicenantes bacterium]|nr:type II toxin-antitoxin system HicB family antitoxin [Candidatus Aminicenantes bacterium]
MEIIFRLDIEKLPEGVYLGTSEDVPGLVAQGRTIDETVDIAKDVARKLYDSYLEDGFESPFRSVKEKRFKVDVAIPVGT